MGDTFQALAVDGENPIASLDPPVPIGHTSADDFVDLK